MRAKIVAGVATLALAGTGAAPAFACHPRPRHRIGSAVCVVKHHGKVKPCPKYRVRWSSWS